LGVGNASIFDKGRIQGARKRSRGEKLVTRHILQQTQLNSNDLATIMKQVQGVQTQVQGVDLKALVRKVDSLEMRFSAFVREFPTTVAEIMRQVLRERDEKKQ
jgi:hypothetical protein